MAALEADEVDVHPNVPLPKTFNPQWKPSHGTRVLDRFYPHAWESNDGRAFTRHYSISFVGFVLESKKGTATWAIGIRKEPGLFVLGPVKETTTTDRAREDCDKAAEAVSLL